MTWIAVWRTIKLLWHFFWDNWKVTIPAVLALIAALFVWNWYQGRNEAVRRAEEALSQAGQIRIDEAKEEVNKASENVNAIKNANHTNLSNDELRQRIIKAARKQK